MCLQVFVPGQWSVQFAHNWVEKLETDLCEVVPNAHITAGIEPIDDPRSMQNQLLD